MAEIGYGITVKVLELIGSVTFQEINSACGVKSDLTKLERTVKAIKAVLLDAEERQHYKKKDKYYCNQKKKKKDVIYILLHL